MGDLDFDIVSDFDIRISDFASLAPLHLSRTLYKSHLFMQNKPNFRKTKMNITSILTKDYEKKGAYRLRENKPNSNPIEANTKPIKANKMPKQTQTNPIKPNFKGKKMLLRLTINTRRFMWLLDRLRWFPDQKRVRISPESSVQ